MSAQFPALTLGASGVTVFRNPANAGGLLGLPDEIIMYIAFRVLVSDQSVDALARTCWRLRRICRDEQFKRQLPGVIFFSHLQRGDFAHREIAMPPNSSGVLPTGNGRLVAYKTHACPLPHAYRSNCKIEHPQACTVTVVDTKENKPPHIFVVPASSSTLRVVGNDHLLACTPKALEIFNLTTGKRTKQLLVEGETVCVAASPCAGESIAYATVQIRAGELPCESMLEVWDPKTQARSTMPLALPKWTWIGAIETYGNIVLGYTQQFGNPISDVKIWDLETQQLYSSCDTEVFARFGVRLWDDDSMPFISSPCVICDHKLVMLRMSERGPVDDIYVWDYAAGPENIVQLNKDEPLSKYSVASLTPSPCGKWVIVLYLDGRLEARRLERPRAVVALRGEQWANTQPAYIPSSRFQQTTPCIAVGRRVLFNASEATCFGIWDPERPHDPITTVSLGDRMVLVNHLMNAVVVDDTVVKVRGGATTGAATRYSPTQNMFFLGGSSILFGCVPSVGPTTDARIVRQIPRSSSDLLPLMIWNFDTRPVVKEQDGKPPEAPSQGPCCIS